MYLKRDVYKRLIEWKESGNHSTLEVSGARQVGKTYLINRFADEYFHHKIYINLFELSGKQFMECYQQALSWKPGTKRPEHPLHEAFRLYEPDFQDTEDTVIIIDEIQESAEIYNRIREFTRQFKCRFIVTGSYLGRVYDSEFRYSSGDVTKITIYTLSYEEFLRVYDSALYEEYCGLANGECDKDIYSSLKEVFDIYCQVGGYPKVVEAYLLTGEVQEAQGELVKIIDTFMNESIRYFTDILDSRVFAQIFLSICRILNREKKGLAEDSISEELQKIVTRDYSSNITKAACNRAISWLYFSGIIGFCAKITEMDILEFKPARRCYFMDLGVANYYLRLTGTDFRVLSGTLNENYVYINLKKRQDFPPEIAFETPAFATYKGGEIDFVAQSLKSDLRYLIEVKAGRGTASTSVKALESGKADRLLYLKGDTKGGREQKVETIPIYMLERYVF
ncbi:ATP-binding protein [Luxibacter massiliensis]|uniref:ATP-binding protein n=1 Tax=Luxibacter massiliensis TaxID=2219695 RepID=UPI000F050015|nr:AAA family ATPase [Luxibacter massiliensis]